MRNIATSSWLVQPLSAPAGAGKTTSMRALRAVAHPSGSSPRSRRVLVLAPTGKAVDVAIREGAGDLGYTVAKALNDLDDGTLTLSHLDLIVLDEASMVGTDELRRLLTTTAKAKTVLVGDAHQLAPVKAAAACSPQHVRMVPMCQHAWAGGLYADNMRDRDVIDSELRLLAAVRQAVREEGGPAPYVGPVDELLDERNAEG